MTEKFTFKCPVCNEELEGENDWIGMKAECPFCKKVITVYKPETLDHASEKCCWCGILNVCPVCGNSGKVHKIFIDKLLNSNDACPEDKAFRLAFNCILIYEFLLRKLTQNTESLEKGKLISRMLISIELALYFLKTTIDKNRIFKSKKNISTSDNLDLSILSLDEHFEDVLFSAWMFRQQMDLETECKIQEKKAPIESYSWEHSRKDGGRDRRYSKNKLCSHKAETNVYFIPNGTDDCYFSDVSSLIALLNQKKEHLSAQIMSISSELISDEDIKHEIIYVISQMPLVFTWERKDVLSFVIPKFILFSIIIAVFNFFMIIIICSVVSKNGFSLLPILMIVYSIVFFPLCNKLKQWGEWFKYSHIYHNIRLLRYTFLIDHTLGIATAPSKYHFPVDRKQVNNYYFSHSNIASMEDFRIFSQFHCKICKNEPYSHCNSNRCILHKNIESLYRFISSQQEIGINLGVLFVILFIVLPVYFFVSLLLPVMLKNHDSILVSVHFIFWLIFLCMLWDMFFSEWFQAQKRIFRTKKIISHHVATWVKEFSNKVE